MIFASRLLSMSAWAAVVLQATAVPHGPSYFANLRRQLQDPCGPVSQYTENPSVDKWNQADTDAWLDKWWTVNAERRASNPHGFAGAFGQYALGQPGWSCQNNGNDGNCDIPICDNTKLNSLGNNTEEAYYVLQALNNIHGFFVGLEQSFNIPAVVAAMENDEIVNNFWYDENNWDGTLLKQLLNILSTVVAFIAGGLAAPVFTLGAFPAIAAASSALVTGGVNAGNNALSSIDSTDVTQSNLGHMMAQAVAAIAKSFIGINNELMYGHGYGPSSDDIRKYLQGGAWVNYPGLQKGQAQDLLISVMQSMMINSMWRMQRVFIIGGGACGDGQGFGSGISPPDDNYICEDGRAWYLYFWQKEAGSTRKRQGWVSRPWGSDRMGPSPRLEQESGSGPFWKKLKPQDAITSSLKSWRAAGNNYTQSTFTDHIGGMLAKDTNIYTEGATMEGLWTIPVCDISKPIADPSWKYSRKEDILHPYGWDERPYWCGPICEGDPDKTVQFYQAANFKDDFDKPFLSGCGNQYINNGIRASGLWWDWTTGKTWVNNRPYHQDN
ncbi:uncharacterized protein PGRI_061590 [Penicillium griseofulvum]|uniref:Uncharacterized protein n=1 Tax=Penicillium patulum TaxID=5078 RepID=A0A135LMK7_PENPA|nr:uncharacterized protein PGRI_061590 [Penicillium griseofulvum]KXG50192.1 hypothetical protein PGRI_061590 [Penicillium griseofulvum]